ncbi:MAG: DUF4062 domain-containing protein [Candidatus Lokiarchaeota archaeon]|nr:DUF4062 domain-containing protein [Candidatus Lokiarchaeota archaeon]
MRPIKVFISGTIEDMGEERNSVELTIKNDLNFDCIRAETRGSTSNTPIEECKKMVEECDIFIGIYGKIYGFKINSHKSVTEKEYDWAVKKRRLIYVKNFNDNEFEEKQLEFIKKATNFHKGNFRSTKFKNIQELVYKIRNDLINEFIIKDYLYQKICETEESEDQYVGKSINIDQNYITHRVGKEYAEIIDDPPKGMKKYELFINALLTKKEIYNDLKLLELICTKKLDKLHSYIIGNPGAGKTTMIRRWTNYLAKDALSDKKNDIIPISITLSWLANLARNHFLPDSITQVLSINYSEKKSDIYYKPLQNKLEDILKTGKGIFLFDALDEVNVKNRSKLVKWIKAQSHYYPNCPIVITTRPAAYQGGISSFQEFEILPFNNEQIDHFINKWFSKDQTKYKTTLHVVDSNDSIQRMSKTPLLLSLFCQLIEEDRFEKDSLNQKEYYLFDSCLNLLLEKWDHNKRIGKIDRSGSTFRLNYNDKISILQDIGLEFYLNEKIVFDRSSLSKRIENYLMNSAPQALKNRDNIDSIINDIEMNSGIIKRLSNNYYSFYNRTFHEYFVTRALIYDAENNKNWIDILSPNFWNPDWSEICKMFISSLPNEAIKILKKSFEFLPPKWGIVVDSYIGSDDRLIIVLEDNYVNWGARLNQARILKPIGYSRCITLINSAGAAGLVDTTSVSSFPKLDIRVKTAYLFLRSLELTSEEYCSIVSDWEVKILGIENEKLYFEQQEAFVKAYEAKKDGDFLEELTQSTIFMNLHKDVPKIYFENTLANMKENNSNISVLAGAAADDAKKITQEIRKQDISYFWIRAKSEGSDDFDTFQKLHTKWRLPINELLERIDRDDEIPVL